MRFPRFGFCLTLRAELRSICLAVLGSNCVLILPHPPVRFGLAPDVGFVGASRCFIDTYDELYPVCRDNFFVLCDCPTGDVQNSLLTVLLTVV